MEFFSPFNIKKSHKSYSYTFHWVILKPNFVFKFEMFLKIIDSLRRLFVVFIYNLFEKMFRKIMFTTKPILSPNSRSCVTITKMTQNLCKTDAKNIILRAKQESNLTFEQISNKLGVNKVLHYYFEF